MTVTEDEAPTSVLVIVAHPDDAEFGCGGTVALWTERGVTVNYVVCTDGALGIMGSWPKVVPPTELRALRQQEQLDAARVLGVGDVQFLGYPDGTPLDVEGLRRELTAAIRRCRPDVVVCQNAVRQYANMDSNHPDHLSVGEAAMRAIYPAAHNPYYFPELLEEGLAPHRVREVWVMGTESPNHLVDVSEVVEQKLVAVRCHRTQNREDPAERLKAEMARVGVPRGVAYAETFSRLFGK